MKELKRLYEQFIQETDPVTAIVGFLFSCLVVALMVAIDAAITA